MAGGSCASAVLGDVHGRYVSQHELFAEGVPLLDQRRRLLRAFLHGRTLRRHGLHGHGRIVHFLVAVLFGDVFGRDLSRGVVWGDGVRVFIDSVLLYGDVLRRFLSLNVGKCLPCTAAC